MSSYTILYVCVSENKVYEFLLEYQSGWTFRKDFIQSPGTHVIHIVVSGLLAILHLGNLSLWALSSC